MCTTQKFRGLTALPAFTLKQLHRPEGDKEKELPTRSTERNRNVRKKVVTQQLSALDAKKNTFEQRCHSKQTCQRLYRRRSASYTFPQTPKIIDIFRPFMPVISIDGFRLELQNTSLYLYLTRNRRYKICRDIHIKRNRSIKYHTLCDIAEIIHGNIDSTLCLLTQ